MPTTFTKSLTLLLLLLMARSGISLATQDQVTSLVDQLKLSRSYEDSIKSLRALAWYHMRHDLSQAEKYTLEFQTSAIQKEDDHTLAVSKHYLGLIRRFEGNYASALSLFKEALAFYKNDPDRKPSQLGALFNLGVINQKIGDYGRALDYFYKENDLAKSLGIKTGRANTLNSIGIIFKETGDFEKAIEIYDEAIPLAINEGDSATYSNILSNRAVVKAEMNDFDGAIIDNLLSLALDREDGYEKGIASSHERLAKVYLKIGNFSKALKSAQACYNLRIGSEYKQDIIESKLLLGEVFFVKKEFNIAERYALQVFTESEELNLVKQMKMAMELLTDIYAETKKHAQAYEAQLHSLLLEEQLGKLEQMELVKNLEIQHEVRERQKDFERLQSENILREIDLTRQKKLRSVLLVALILAIITIILISRILSLRIFAQKLKAERSAIRQEREVQEIISESKMTQLSAMIQGQELERNRIAKDLHDGLGGLLSTVKIHFMTVQQEIESVNKLFTFKKATHMLDDACDEVRRIAHNMMPDALDQLGLSAVILDLSQALEQKGYIVHTQLLNVEDRLPEELEINIYRIIQELINNIIKYAEASKIVIQLSRDGHQIFLTVEDDGRGFDPTKNYTGIGLQNIKSRVDFLSGEIDISSQAGEGTSIFISLDLHS